MNSVSIVIVNWNTGTLLTRCLAALCATPDTPYIARIVVVDNASTDDSLVAAQQYFLNLHCRIPVTYIRRKHNAGFARATNVGIAAAEQSTHILMLNPDTEVLPGALEAMIDVLERDHHIAVVGPMLVYPDQTLQPSVRSFPSFAALVWLFLKLQWLLSTVPWWRRYIQATFDYTREQAVDQVMGAAFLIHADVLNILGNFDERFRLWFEEVDYCKRAHDAGWKVVYTPRARVIHHGAASFNQLVGLKRSIPFLMSALQYTHKHLGVARWLLLLSLFPLAVVLSIPASYAHLIGRNTNKITLQSS